MQQLFHGITKILLGTEEKVRMNYFDIHLQLINDRLTTVHNMTSDIHERLRKLESLCTNGSGCCDTLNAENKELKAREEKIYEEARAIGFTEHARLSRADIHERLRKLEEKN